jgi:hypothetical protein
MYLLSPFKREVAAATRPHIVICTVFGASTVEAKILPVALGKAQRPREPVSCNQLMDFSQMIHSRQSKPEFDPQTSSQKSLTAVGKFDH